ncbi:unnamed protein product [Closterium sp. NIES-64]|nr:unnamed protein product [Closterium sp. NIES-64]
MYAVTYSEENEGYRCFQPDPGIGTAALGACEAAALGASASALSGTGETALSGTASSSSSLTFTLDSGASRSFFRDRTTLTPLGRPVAVSLADPSGGPVLSHFSTVLPCPAAPSGTLSGLYLPSFSTNLVSGADLQDVGVHQFTPASQRVTHCTEARTGRHLATFSRRPGSSLYTLTVESPPVPASGQVAASGQVLAAASRTFLCPLCRGSPPGYSSLLPLPPDRGSPADASHGCVGPSPVRGQGHERYFLLVVDDYSRYTTVLPLRSKGAVTEVLIDWIREARLQLRKSFGSDFPVLRLHSDRGGEFSSRLLRDYCPQPSPPGLSALRCPQPAVDGEGWRCVCVRVSGISGVCPRLVCGQAVPRAAPCVFLGFPTDAPGWLVLPPLSLVMFLSSQDVTFDESVPFYRLFPYRTPSLPPPPDFLVPVPPPVDPLPPQVPAPSGVSQVDAVDPVEVTGDSGAAAGAEPGGADSGGAVRGGAEPGCWCLGGAGSGAAEPGGAELGAAEPGGAAVSGSLAAGGVLLSLEVLLELSWELLSTVEGAGAAGPGALVLRVLLELELLRACLAERREPASRLASPVSVLLVLVVAVRVSVPPPVPGTHGCLCVRSTAPLRAPLPSPPESSLPAPADPESDSLRAASPTVTRLLATVVSLTPSFESTAASALVAELVDFAARCRLDYAASLVLSLRPVCPPSVGGECALGTDVIEDRQEELQCLAAASPHLASVRLPLRETGCTRHPDSAFLRGGRRGSLLLSVAAAMDAEMASWKSTGTYVDAVPLLGANIVSGM